MDVRRTVGLLAGVVAALPLLVGEAGSAASPVAAAAECRGVPATIVGGGTVLKGTSGDDVIVATRRTTRVQAGKGDDLICGSHFVRGQGGRDRIHVTGGEPSSLYISAGPGDDVVRFHGRAGYSSTGTHDGVHGGPGDDLMVSGRGTVWFSGSWGDDRLVSGPGGDLLDGDGGNDLLLGGSGQDIMYGGSGNDELRGRARSDELDGGPGRDAVFGGPGWDVCPGGNELEVACESDSWL